MEKFKAIIGSIIEWTKTAKATITSVLASLDELIQSFKDLFGIKEEPKEETEEEETEEK
jgi:hypothetical protein